MGAPRITLPQCFLLRLRWPAALHSAPAAAGEAQSLVDKAELTVNAFRVQPDMGSMRSLMRRAHGVLVIPRVLKAVFFIRGEGGTGVLMTRQLNTWSAPAFYTTGRVALACNLECKRLKLCWCS
jgi:lipid-binding SYLF domain-containing protein